MKNKVELQSLSDAQLVAIARNGSEAAFGELTERHRQKCIDIAGYFLRNHGDAEDEVQNAFVKAFQHLDQYQNEAEFSTWLSRIVANQCLMVLRVRRRARFVYLDESAPEHQRSRTLELPSSGPDPEGDLGAEQVSFLLHREMNRIPPLLRHVMQLRDVQQLPMTAVARQLGITVPAAKSRLLRARLELRNRLTKNHRWIRATSAPLSRVAAPLDRVGRHYALAAH